MFWHLTFHRTDADRASDPKTTPLAVDGARGSIGGEVEFSGLDVVGKLPAVRGQLGHHLLV